VLPALVSPIINLEIAVAIVHGLLAIAWFTLALLSVCAVAVIDVHVRTGLTVWDATSAALSLLAPNRVRPLRKLIAPGAAAEALEALDFDAAGPLVA